MAWYNYPKGFKVYKNTPNFVPKPGDFAVWGTGSFNNGVGHVAIVVGPSDKNRFTSIDQNWFGANSYTGSPGAKINHTYNGLLAFVRPAYQAEFKPKPDTKPSPTPKPDTKPSPTPKSSDTKTETTKNMKEDTKPITKKVTKVSYTSFASDLDKELEYIHQFAVDNGEPIGKVKGIYIKECPYLRSVEELYLQRNKYVNNDEYPHVYIDRERIWTPRASGHMAPEHPGWLVLEVCGGQTESKRQFMLNQIQALIYGVWLMSWSNIKLSESTIKCDENIWRTMKDLINYDLIKNNIPDESKYKEVEKKIIGMYLNKDKLQREVITTTTTKATIKVKNTTSVDTPAKKSTPTTKKSNTSTSKTTPTPTKPRIVEEKSTVDTLQAAALFVSAQM